MTRYHNKNRQNKIIAVDEEIFVKSNRRDKLAPRYKKEIVKEVKNNIVIVKNRNKEVHKDNIRP